MPRKAKEKIEENEIVNENKTVAEIDVNSAVKKKSSTVKKTSEKKDTAKKTSPKKSSTKKDTKEKTSEKKTSTRKKKVEEVVVNEEKTEIGTLEEGTEESSVVGKKSSTTKKTSSTKSASSKKTSTAKKSAKAIETIPDENIEEKKKSSTRKSAKKDSVDEDEKGKKSSTRKNTTKKTTSKATSKTTSTKRDATKRASTTKVTRKRTSKKSTEPEESPIQIAEYYDLPCKYGNTVVKILAQTPKTLFVYWEVSDLDIENFKKNYGDDFFKITKPVIIVHNLTLNKSYEVEINDFANCWYLNIEDSDCKFDIELGRRFITPISTPGTEQPDYVYIATSNNLRSPNDHILFEKIREFVIFKNVSDDTFIKKSIKTFKFLKDIYKFYKEMYDDEILKNPSSQFKF